MKKELLEYSFKNKLSHIPSALSMLDYIDVMFTHWYIKPEDNIIIGKPFGAQAYYLVWQQLSLLGSIEHLSVGVKHSEIEFVDYGEETMGNALGVATGIAMANKKMTWVNLSDACLQMGNTLEAIQFIGQNNIYNMLVTVDYNKWQVRGKTSDIINTDPIIDMCAHYGWHVIEADGHNVDDIHSAVRSIAMTDKIFKPIIIFFHTVKGKGIPVMEKDPQGWHYRSIANESELLLLTESIR